MPRRAGLHAAAVLGRAPALLEALANAVKHAGKSPQVSIEAKEAGSARRRDVVITVRDSGAGIGKDDLLHIFEPFYRMGEELTRTTQGTGIGLALARK